MGQDVGTSISTRTEARLGIAQMLTLMRVEFQRARATQAPLVCWMIDPGPDCVDAAYSALKSQAGRLSLFGMALATSDRIMALFPGRQTHELEPLSRALMESVPKLRLGGAHNQLAETSASFEGLVERAGYALQETRNGPARCLLWGVQARELETLRGDLQAAKVQLHKQDGEAREFAELGSDVLLRRLDGLFETVSHTPDIDRLRREVLALAAHELFEERTRAVAEQHNQIALLERRIEKLNAAMGLAERQLESALQNRTMDEGVASIHRTVQGLSTDASHREQKQALMASIFEQNLALRQRSPQTQAPASAHSGR